MSENHDLFDIHTMIPNFINLSYIYVMTRWQSYVISVIFCPFGFFVHGPVRHLVPATWPTEYKNP